MIEGRLSSAKFCSVIKASFKASFLPRTRVRCWRRNLSAACNVFVHKPSQVPLLARNTSESITAGRIPCRSCTLLIVLVLGHNRLVRQVLKLLGFSWSKFLGGIKETSTLGLRLHNRGERRAMLGVSQQSRSVGDCVIEGTPYTEMTCRFRHDWTLEPPHKPSRRHEQT